MVLEYLTLKISNLEALLLKDLIYEYLAEFGGAAVSRSRCMWAKRDVCILSGKRDMHTGRRTRAVSCLARYSVCICKVLNLLLGGARALSHVSLALLGLHAPKTECVLLY